VEAELASGEKEISKKQLSQKGDLDELDAYMSDLKRDTTQDKIKRRAAKVEFIPCTYYIFLLVGVDCTQCAVLSSNSLSRLL
jgi:hypothetical protein